MTLFTFSTDGTTPINQRQSLPKQLVRDLATQQWSVATPGDSERFGWYLVTEVPDPGDSAKTITHNGSVFVETWTFEQARQDDRLANEARDTQKAADVAVLRSPAAATPIREEVERLNRIVADIIDGNI